MLDIFLRFNFSPRKAFIYSVDKTLHKFNKKSLKLRSNSHCKCISPVIYSNLNKKINSIIAINWMPYEILNKNYKIIHQKYFKSYSVKSLTKIHLKQETI